MTPFPLPVRVAAGLVATAVEQARDLPRLVVEFPVTAVSQALQVSMRVQQKVTELAIKGDRALGTLRPVEEKPAWATFDEDEPPRRNGASTVTELRPQRLLEPTERPLEQLVAPPGQTPADVAARGTGQQAKATEPRLSPPETTSETPAAETSAAQTPADVAARVTALAADPPRPEPPAPTAETDRGGPNALPNYSELTIPQLRGKLRHLRLEDLQALLAWETTHGDRAPYVTMLTNRITTVIEA